MIGRVELAISVRQPWAHCILTEGKDIENRVWRSGQRGRVALHTGLALAAEPFFEWLPTSPLRERVTLQPHDVPRLPRGAVIGLVDIIDCVEASDSEWFDGPFGFVLANPRPLTPIPCPGKLNFFALRSGVSDAIDAQLRGPDPRR